MFTSALIFHGHAKRLFCRLRESLFWSTNGDDLFLTLCGYWLFFPKEKGNMHEKSRSQSLAWPTWQFQWLLFAVKHGISPAVKYGDDMGWPCCCSCPWKRSWLWNILKWRHSICLNPECRKKIASGLWEGPFWCLECQGLLHVSTTTCLACTSACTASFSVWSTPHVTFDPMDPHRVQLWRKDPQTMWCWHWASAITGHEVNHIQSRCQMLASPSGWSRRRRNGSGINWQRTQRFLHQQTVHRARLAQRILFQHNFEIPVDLRRWWGLQEYATRWGRTVLHWRCQRPERSCFCNFKSHHSGLRTAHLSISISSDDLKEGCFPVSAGLRGFFIRYFFYAASFKSFRKHGRTVPSKGAPCCNMFPLSFWGDVGDGHRRPSDHERLGCHDEGWWAETRWIEILHVKKKGHLHQASRFGESWRIQAVPEHPNGIPLGTKAGFVQSRV